MGYGNGDNNLGKQEFICIWDKDKIKVQRPEGRGGREILSRSEPSPN